MHSARDIAMLFNMVLVKLFIYYVIKLVYQTNDTVSSIIVGLIAIFAKIS